MSDETCNRYGGVTYTVSACVEVCAVTSVTPLRPRRPLVRGGSAVRELQCTVLGTTTVTLCISVQYSTVVW